MEEGRTVVLGDFNAHHQWWGGAEARTDTAGRQLADKFFNSNLCLLNDGSFTRVPDREDHNPTTIGLTLVIPLLFGDADWEVGDLMGSDHLPIRLTLGGYCRKRTNTGRKGTTTPKQIGQPLDSSWKQQSIQHRRMMSASGMRGYVRSSCRLRTTAFPKNQPKQIIDTNLTLGETLNVRKNRLSYEKHIVGTKDVN
ncbi:hypothetical protein ACOMHN_002930 [Nucella lapillus]